jgi:hypothetical protein
MLALTLCAPALAQTSSVSPTNLNTIGALPDSIDLAIGLNDLAQHRATPAGKALECFVKEVSDWGRTSAAWSDLSRALDMTQDQSVESLLGSRVILASSGLDAGKSGASAQFALISEITPDVEARVRAKLKPSPRGLTNHLPILALEDGAFELATDRRASGLPRVLIAPEGSSAMFDELLPTLSGTPSSKPPLSSWERWPRVKELGTGDVTVLLRSPQTDDFFALTGWATEDGLTARFAANDSMLIGGLVAPEGLSSRDAIWPTTTIDALEEGSVLLVAGSPRQVAQPAPMKAESTLLLSLLGMINLSPDLQHRIDGNAVIAVHPEDSDGSSGAVTVMAVLPVPDIVHFESDAVHWAMSMGVTDDDWKNAPAKGKQGIWSVPVTATEHGLAHEVLPRNGTMAWTIGNAKDSTPEHPEGWFVVGIRFGPGDAAQLLPVVERVRDLLETEDRTEQKDLFRLVVRPRNLSILVRPLASTVASKPPAGLTGAKDPLDAMRWLDQVESRISREGPGLVEGTVSVRLNFKLLDQPAK